MKCFFSLHLGTSTCHLVQTKLSKMGVWLKVEDKMFKCVWLPIDASSYIYIYIWKGQKKPKCREDRLNDGELYMLTTHQAIKTNTKYQFSRVCKERN